MRKSLYAFALTALIGCFAMPAFAAAPSIPPPAPVFLSTQEICASTQPVTIYGASGATAKTVATCTIPAGTIQPGSVMELDVHFNFPTPNHAGRTVSITLGGQTLGQAFPTASLGAQEAKELIYVAADAQSFWVQTVNLNNILTPTTTTPCSATPCGAPGPSYTNGSVFTAQTSVTTNLTLDMTQTQNLVISMDPINNDIATLTGFSLTMHSPATGPANYAPSGAVAVFANSLGAGTGSLGANIQSPTITTTSGSQSVTLSSSSGVVAGDVVVSAGCVPAGTIMTSTGTINQPASGNCSSQAASILSGSWPQQLMYLSAGRPVYNNSVGGTTSAQISARQALDKIAGRSWIMAAVDLCRNDVGQVNLTSICQTNLAAMVSRLYSPKRWAWSTTIPATNETVGTTNWNAIVAVNNSTKALYPSNTVDVFSTLTSNGTTNIPLQYRNATNTTGSCTSGTNSLTVASASGLSNGMYVISPGSTAIDNGTVGPTGATYSAPTITNISGTTITLSANCSSTLTSGMVSFIGATEVHLNDLGYSVGYETPFNNWLVSNGY